MNKDNQINHKEFYISIAEISIKLKNVIEKLDISLLDAKITRDELLQKIIHLRDDFNARYITQERFNPVEKIVYGMVSIVLISVMGAIIFLVVK